MQRISNWFEDHLRRSTRSVSRSRRKCKNQKNENSSNKTRSTKIAAFGNNLRWNLNEIKKSNKNNSFGYFQEGFYFFKKV